MSDNYWQTHSIEEHEQFLKDLINQGLSNGEMQKRIAERFGENTEEFEQKQQLESEINQRISPKMRDTLSLERYFMFREKIREQILGSPIEEAKKEAKENARSTGNTCIFCGRNEISSKGAEWLCKTCGKRFRKR